MIEGRQVCGYRGLKVKTESEEECDAEDDKAFT